MSPSVMFYHFVMMHVDMTDDPANQWDQNGPKEPVEQLCVSTEYGGDGGLAVVDKDNFIRVRKILDSTVGGVPT